MVLSTLKLLKILLRDMDCTTGVFLNVVIKNGTNSSSVSQNSEQKGLQLMK